MMVGTLLAVPAWTMTDSYRGMDDFLAERIRHFPGLEVELARLNAVMTHDMRHQLDKITAPTGVISAHDDALTPPAMSDELAERITGAKQIKLAQGGHFCPVTVTDEYNEKLLGLLSEINA